MLTPILKDLKNRHKRTVLAAPRLPSMNLNAKQNRQEKVSEQQLTQSYK